MILYRLLLLLLCSIWCLTSCRNLRNNVDKIALDCGISRSDAQNGKWIPIRGPKGSSLPTGQVIQVSLVQGPGQTAQDLDYSQQYCVNLQSLPTEGFLTVAYQDRFRYVASLGEVRKAESIVVEDVSDLDISFACESKSNLGRDVEAALVLKEPLNAQIFEVTAQMGGQDYKLLKPGESTPSLPRNVILPQGLQTISFQVQSLVSLPRFQNKTTKAFQCSLIIDRTPPNIALVGREEYIFADGNATQIAEPGQLLSLAVRDENSGASARYCLYRDGEVNASTCGDGTAVRMPESGVWRLEYEAFDAAGNRTEQYQATTRIYDRQGVSNVEEQLERSRAALQADDKIEALEALDSAFLLRDKITDKLALQDAGMLLNQALLEYGQDLNVILKKPEVDAIAIQASPNGRYIYVAENTSNMTRVYDLEGKATYEIPQSFANFYASSSGALFSGTLFFPTEGVPIYTVEGSIKDTIPKDGGRVLDIKFKPDDTGYYYLRSRGTQIFGREIGSDQTMSYKLNPDGFFSKLLLGKDGRFIAAVDSFSPMVEIFKVGTPESVGIIERKIVGEPALLPSGDRIVTISELPAGKMSIEIWDFEQLPRPGTAAQPVQTWEFTPEVLKFKELKISPDGQSVVILFDNQDILYQNFKSKLPRWIKLDSKAKILTGQYIDSATFQIIDEDGISQSINLAMGIRVSKRAESSLGLRAAAYSDDGQVLAINNPGNELIIVSTQTDLEPRILNTSSEQRVQMVHRGNDSFLAYYEQGLLKIDSGGGGSSIFRESIPDLQTIVPGPEGVLLIGTSQGGRILKGEGRNFTQSKFAEQDSIQSMCWNPAGIVTSNLKNRVKFWNPDGSFRFEKTLNDRGQFKFLELTCSPFEDLAIMEFQSFGSLLPESIFYIGNELLPGPRQESAGDWVFFGKDQYGFISERSNFVSLYRIEDNDFIDLEQKYLHKSGLTDIFTSERWTLTAGKDRRVKLWEGGQEVRSFATSAGAARTVAFLDAEENLIGTFADGGQLTVWDRVGRPRLDIKVETLSRDGKLKMMMSRDYSWMLVKNDKGDAVVLDLSLQRAHDTLQAQLRRIYTSR